MKKETIGFLVLILLVVSGCSGMTFGKTKETTIADTSHTGTKGVTIEFVKNNPPDIAFGNTGLDVVLALRNEGASDVRGGTIYLGGYDSRIFNINPKSQQFNLEPKTKFNTFGGYNTFQFSTQSAVTLPKGTETLPQTFMATACYHYTTQASIPVCIDPNPGSVLENEACRVANPSVGGGQGAPVAVSSIQEIAAPGKVQFVITITNMGDGQVLNSASVGSCQSTLKYSDVDTITWTASLSSFPMDCKPQQVKLANKQGVLVCTATLSDQTSPAFTSVLELTLDYGYMSQKTKSISVRSIS